VVEIEYQHRGLAAETHLVSGSQYMQRQYSSAAQGARVARRRIVLVTALCASCFAAVAHFSPRTDADPSKSFVASEAAAAAAVAPTSGVPLRDPAPVETAQVAAPATLPQLNDIIPTALNDSLNVPDASNWQTVEIRSGQSLSNIFDNLDLPAEDWMAILRLGGDALQLRHLRAGSTMNVLINDDRLDELTYALDETHTLDVRRGSRGLEALTLTADIDHHRTEVAGTIENSLFLDGRHAKLSDRLIMQFADLFNYDIDFGQDLQPGDHFTVVYDVLYKNGHKLRDGDILAAEFINQGKTYRAIRFTDSTGHFAYYTPDGQSLRKAFIRTPVDFARISSGFSLARWHPILNIMRAHKGVDYAASTGTPVKSTGDGRIEFMGVKSGYGNVVMIKHGTQYETVYGHLSRFKSGLSVGSKVQQGQVVAYVGMTGLATAPHLHYEFRVNGIHQNPVTVALPRANPISGKQLAQFRNSAAPLVASLDANRPARYASLSTIRR